MTGRILLSTTKFVVALNRVVTAWRRDDSGLEGCSLCPEFPSAGLQKLCLTQQRGPRAGPAAALRRRCLWVSSRTSARQGAAVKWVRPGSKEGSKQAKIADLVQAVKAKFDCVCAPLLALCRSYPQSGSRTRQVRKNIQADQRRF